MKLIPKTFACDSSIDDALLICDHLAVGSWAIESGHDPVPAHDPGCVPAWRELTAGAALSVGSGTVLRLALGSALVDWLERAGIYVGPFAGLALHELIVNAAVHGNLGISSKHLNVWQDLSAREAAIAAACDDPVCRGRLTTITLGWTNDRVVAIISDEGDGYGTEQPALESRASGRGLQIARAAGGVEVCNGGRQTVLTLDRLRRGTAG